MNLNSQLVIFNYAKQIIMNGTLQFPANLSDIFCNYGFVNR